MRIIPVLDVQQGIAVHGIAGKRECYQPVVNCQTASTRPAEIAAAWRSTMYFHELYLADLSAIRRGPLDLPTYESLLVDDWQIWLDAGIADHGRCAELLALQFGEKRIHQVILALESLPSPDTLARIAAQCDRERLTFSLDLFQGQVWSAERAWSGLTPANILELVIASGIRRVIVLDVSTVGTSNGPSTLTICSTLRRQFGELEIIAGGGVRNFGDVSQFAAAGCDGVLVATALHRGQIGPEQLAAAGRL